MTEFERVRESLMIAAWECVFGSGGEEMAEMVHALGERYCALLAQSDGTVASSSDTVSA